MLRLAPLALIAPLLVTPATRADMLFPTATSVRAYLYKQDPRADTLMPDFRKLNATAVPAKGIALTPAQIERLHEAVPAKHEVEIAPARCFRPRHGFIFEDAEGKVVGTLDLSFECNNYVLDAPGYRDRVSAAEETNRQPKGAPDWALYREQVKEVDAIRAQFHMPPGGAALDWALLADLVNDLGLPPKPTPGDYARLAKQKPR